MDRKTDSLVLSLLPLIALFAMSPSYGFFKVLDPDGKVTYTDRAPRSSQGKVTPLSADRGTIAGTSLPLELRQPVSRYPATLFVMGNCAPCDSARALLRQRGIPYAEKTISTEEDVEALQRLTGFRDAPTLMLGTQPLHGLTPELWNSYLDLAGYPRESRLPANYQHPLPTPLTQRSDATPPEAVTSESQIAAEPAKNATEPSPPSGIRF